MGDIFASIQSGLLARGFSSDQALGITSGVYAEGGVSKNGAFNINPTSGAFGLGQWLGDRKQALFKFSGTTSPTFDQQLDYLASELRGGDKGGKAVLSASGTSNILDAYITKFMRPAKGAETTGDLTRGNSYLNGGGAGRDALTSFLGSTAGNGIADGLGSLGSALSAPGDAIDSATAKLVGGLDPSAWFQRIALAILAILLIGIALSMLAGKPALAIASKVPPIPV